MKYSPHLTRFFASLPPNKLAPLLIEALNALNVKHKVKPPAVVLVGGYDVRKEKFKGRIMLEGFEWKGMECSIAEMAREEVRCCSPTSLIELMFITQGQPNFMEAILEGDSQNVTDRASFASQAVNIPFNLRVDFNFDLQF